MGVTRSLIAQIQEVERELALRERVYRRETNARKQNENAEHMLRMQCVLATLKRLQQAEPEVRKLPWWEAMWA
jgi:hypothetical protein